MKNIWFFLCFCLISSCYVYRSKSENDQQSVGFEKQIQPEKRYQILSEGNKIKIKAVSWDGDSLIAETGSIKKKTLKFNKNQINSVENRVFSRGRSDAMTFASYALIGGIIYFLTR
ncbi:hypothetical protein EDM00_07995 [Ornithobacterium rhinotracheale]|uniref:hypothetical protein n=1 Tax=Ornithobacterium rhinotracheale TaxID=28251 RepID=UPI00129CFD98|nr:hypothetical protein [Ornithobacterium rhinotracheale]MRI63927.1 hypothetical protein [Ornithobacterium rhinotracheale]